jgi:hypothetical protein
MAQIPAAVASTATASIGAQVGSFVVNLGANYLLGRLAAQDGPRLGNLSAAGGEYGGAMPKLFGEKVRCTGIFIAQADIKETRHTVEDYSEIVGALTGAVQGFMVGGPVGAVVGAVIGGLLGAATPNQHYYTYSDTFALLLADRFGDDPIEGINKMWAAGKVIFAGTEPVVAQTFDGDGRLVMKKWGKNKFFKSLTLHTGADVQALDPVLGTVLGETSGYPFTAYVTFEDLQLMAWGNSVPAVDVLTSVATGQTVAGTVERIAGAAGIDTERDISTLALVDRVNRGYSITSETSCWDAIKPLLPAFGVDAAEVSGQIRFIKRNQALRATIPPEDMGAHAFGDEPPERFTFARATDLDLPKETSLTFIDPARDYQANTASSTRTEGSAKSNLSVTLPLVLTADEGASTAALMHWDSWLGRTSVRFALTDAWLGVDPGAAYAVPFHDLYVPYRVTRRARGANGVIEVEALSDEEVTYTAVVAGSSGTLPDEEPTAFARTRLVLIDMPIFSDLHDDYGFYVAMAGDQAYWDRGKVQASSDGTTFVTLIDSAESAAIGDVTGTLAAGSTSGLDDTLDTTSVLTVVLLHDGMALTSATDVQLDAWANFAFVGKNGQGEYLQFKTATKVAPRTWQLTNLRRGRKGTDWAIGLHGAGEEFAVLGGHGVFRIVYSNDSQWGMPLTFRGVSLHEDGADAATQSFTNTGEGKRPYSPVEVEGSWDGSNNLTISCTARSRLNAGGLGIDDRDEVEVEILNGAGRTIVHSGTTADYLATEQTADGITPGGTVIGRIRRTSDVNDGRWRNFTLEGPLTRRADTTAITADTTTHTADLA